MLGSGLSNPRKFSLYFPTWGADRLCEVTTSAKPPLGLAFLNLENPTGCFHLNWRIAEVTNRMNAADGKILGVNQFSCAKVIRRKAFVPF